MFEARFEITAADLETPYDHVHHGEALRFLERGRLEYLKACEIDYEALLAEGLFLVVTDIRAKYKRELKPGPITVTCERPAVERKVLSLHQRVLNEKGKVAVEVEISFQMLSGALRRSIVPPAEFVAKFVSDKE